MTATADLPQVLVIDDEMGPRESLRMLLKPSYQVHTADSVEIGLQLLNEKKPDAIVLDIRMPVDLVTKWSRRSRQVVCPVSCIRTASIGAPATAREVVRRGGYGHSSSP